MKKLLSVLFIFFVFANHTFAQSNSNGGSNYYSSLIGKTLPTLGVSGGTALVFVDMVHGNDGVVDALTANGFTTTVATSASDFVTQLQSGGFDLAVLFTQGESATYYSISTTAISNFIASGKKMIFTTWTNDDAAYATLFDASFSGSTNLTTVTVTDPTIASGITNPIILSNPGWFIGFSIGLQAINGAEVLGTFENGNAAIVRGNGGNTIMLGYLSDAPALAQRQAIFSNVSGALGANPVPVPYSLIIVAFVLIAAGVVFTKRKVIFG